MKVFILLKHCSASTLDALEIICGGGGQKMVSFSCLLLFFIFELRRMSSAYLGLLRNVILL